MRYLTLILLLITTQLHAADPWSRADIYREVASQTLNVMDTVTTNYKGETT